jgi:phytoene desaturase
MRVTLLEAASYLGGKSRRLTLAGQRIDTGPEFLTFLGIWEEYLRRWDGREGEGGAARIADLDLLRLPEIGTYHYRGDVCSLPVEEGHPWHEAWQRYVEMHSDFGPDVTLMLVSDWKDPRIRPVLRRIAGLAKLTAKRATSTASRGSHGGSGRSSPSTPSMVGRGRRTPRPSTQPCRR